MRETIFLASAGVSLIVCGVGAFVLDGPFRRRLPQLYAPGPRLRRLHVFTRSLLIAAGVALLVWAYRTGRG